MALTDSLRAWWDFENDLLDAHTSDGTSEDLSENGTVAYTSGKVGNAVDISSGNYPSIASTSALQADQSFTIAGWVRPDTLTDTGALMAKAGAGDPNEYRVLVDSSGKIEFLVELTDGSKPSVSNNNYAQTGVWTFIVAEYDASTPSITLYLDNDSNETKSSSIATTAATGAKDVTVGHDPAAGGTIDGQIDSLAFWERTLTSSERTELWNSGNGVSYSDISASADVSATATLFGAGAATATASKNATITSTTDGAGDATITISKVQTGQLDILGRPAVTVTEGTTADVSAVAAMFGAGSQTVSAQAGVSAGATASGAGGHSVTAEVSIDAAASIVGVGNQSATPSKGVSVTATALGAGQTLVDAVTGQSASASATIAGAGSHSVTAVPSVDVSASMNGAGGHTVGASGDRKVTVTALGSGGATTTQTVNINVSTQASASGAALSVAEALVSAQARMDGAGQLLVTVTKGEVASAIDTVELQAIYDTETGVLAIYDIDQDLDAIYQTTKQLEGAI